MPWLHLIQSTLIFLLYINIPTERYESSRGNNINSQFEIQKIISNSMKPPFGENHAATKLFYIQRKILYVGLAQAHICEVYLLPLPEIYLNNFENNHIFLVSNNTHARNILFYKTYVDEVFLIYKGNAGQPDFLCTYLN